MWRVVVHVKPAMLRCMPTCLTVKYIWYLQTHVYVVIWYHLVLHLAIASQLQGAPAGALVNDCARVIAAHVDQVSPDAVVLCLHGFTRAGLVRDDLHRALWGRLAASRWRQLSPKQLTLALWSAAVSRQQSGE